MFALFRLYNRKPYSRIPLNGRGVVLLIPIGYFIHVRDSKYVLDYQLKFSVAMNEEVDGACHDFVLGNGVQTVDGEMKIVGNGVDDVTQQMLPVNRHSGESGRVENVWILLEVHTYYIITPLRSLTDGNAAVPSVDGDGAISLLEADNLFARDWIAVAAAAVF